MPHKTRKPNKHQSSREQAAQGGILPMMINAVRGTLVACMAGAVLLLIAAAIAYAQDDPDRLTAPLGYTAAAITALLAGFLASRWNRRAVLLCGLFSAACLLLIFFVLSLIPLQGTTSASPALSLALHAAMLPLTSAGAYLGRRRARR